MAKSFNLTARINAQLGNVRPVVNNLKRQLSGIKANVNININPNAQRNIIQLNRSLVMLNQTLKVTTQVARQASASINTLGNAAATANLSKIAQQAAQVNKALSGINKQAKTAGNQMQEFGRVSGLAIRRFAGFSIATGAVFGLVNAFSNAVSKAIAFDQQMVRIGQAVRSTKDGMRVLAGEITRLSQSLGVSSAELAEVSLILAQAGLTARDTKVALEALAKSTLAPTFTDITNTVEGSIAAIAQFEIGVNDLEKVLGSINSVSAKFAVESDDIIAAIRRTGGVFAAASKGVSQGTDALNEFIAIFTSIRATTRESAETIATGLRTIFTRFQRADTIRNLESLGIQLTDAEGKFIGAYKAVDALANGLKALDPRDLRFSEIVEQLGGYRQVSKVIPLLSQTEKRLQALAVAQTGQNSLSEDAEKAQEALANRIAKVREEFLALVREITETSSFKTLVDITLKLTSGLIDLARTLKPLIPLFATLGAIKLGVAATSFTSGFFRGARGRNEGGYAPKFHGGGLVPGGRGVKDDYPAILQAGEYVIRRKAVDKIGRRRLDELNRKGYAEGGLVNQREVGAAILAPEGDYKTAQITVGPNDAKSLREPKTYSYIRQGLPSAISKHIRKSIASGIAGVIDKGAALLGGPSFASKFSAGRLIKTAGLQGIEGNLFEGMLSLATSDGTFDSAKDPNRPFDFTTGFKGALGRHFTKLTMQYIDAKRSAQAAEPKGIAAKIANQLDLEAGVNKGGSKDDAFKKKGGRTQSAESIAKAEAAKAARRAKMNARLGIKFASGGEVPAMLTRGEYVISKKAADKIGPEMLDRLNNADRLPKYHTGGRVGFAKGGNVSTATQNAVINALDSGVSKNELENTIARLSSTLGKGTKELDRAIRAAASAMTKGKSAQEAYSEGIMRATKVADAAARQRNTGGGFNPFTSAGRAAIGRNSTFLNGGALKGVKGAFGNTLGGIKNNPLAALGGIAIATQGISQQFDPSGTNKFVQGATGALSGAAAGAAFGGPLGAIVGGVYGLASGAINADIAKANEEANKALKKSTQEVDKAFKDFVKSGSLQTIENAFSSANAAAGLKLTALRKENAGVLGSLYGFLGQGVGFTKAEGQDFGANLLSSVGNMLGLVSDQALDKQIARQRIGRYDQLSVENQASAEVARNFFERQITSGKSIDQILSNKAGVNAAQTFLASNLTTDEEKNQFQSQLERVAAAREGGNADEIKQAESQLRSLVKNSIRPLLQEQQAEVEMRNRLSEAVAYTTRDLDRFYDRLNEISAAFQRVNDYAGLAQKNLDLIAEELSGGITVRSRRGRDNQNVIGNLEAFSTDRVARAASNLNLRLGNNAASQELTQNITAAKAAKDIVPSILEAAAEKNKIEGSESVGAFIERRLRDRLGQTGASQTIIDNVVAKANAAVQSRKDAGGQSGSLTEDFFTSGEIETALQDAFKEVIKVAEEATKSLDAAFDSYQAGLESYVKLQLSYNKALDNAFKVRAEGELKIRELKNEDIPFNDVIKPFEESIKRLTGGNTNAKGIGANVAALQSQQDALLRSANNAEQTGDRASAAQFSQSAAQLEIAIQENREALETLSQDTTVLTEVQRRLADMEAKRQQAEKTLEDLAFGNREDRLEFNRRAGLANRLIGGEQLRGPNLKAALDTIKELGNVLNAGGLIDDNRVKALNKFGQNAVLNDPFLKAIFGGVDPGLKKIGAAVKNEDDERKNLIGIAEAAVNRQADAADALAKLQGNTNIYLQELNKTLQVATATINQTLASLSQRVPVNTGQNFNSGGWIPGGGPNKDTVPAMLTTGEFVVNREAARRNADLLEEINNGERFGFAKGGSVTREKAIAAAIARKQRLGRSTYWSQLALSAIVKAGKNATPEQKRLAVYNAQVDEYNRRFAAREARYKARREANPLRYKSINDFNGKGRGTPWKGPASATKTGMSVIGNRISDIARKSAQLGGGFSALTKEDQAFINSLSPAQKAMGSRLFKQFKDKKARTGSAYNRGGPVGGARPSSRGSGSTFDAAVAQFGQYAQMFASSAAQFERAANIMSKINIPNKIEMSGTHTVQVIINGADVLSKMEGPVRDLVTSEIQKAMSRHINPITGETTGEFNG